MKIIRWLLSHTFLILVIVVVIYGYMFWGNLAGENTPAGKALAYLSSEFVEVEEFIAAVKEKQAKLSQNDTSAQSTDESTSTQETTRMASANSDVASTEAVAGNNKDIEQQPVSISYSHNQRQITQDSTGAIETQPSEKMAITAVKVESGGAEAQVSPTHTASVQTTPATATDINIKPGDDTFVSEDVAEQLDNVDENGIVIDIAKQGSALKEQWITARKSYYQRNYPLSVQSYQKVIASTEDNHDAYGELGNVYFNQGKNKLAASAYYEAAVILIRKGQVSRARSLVGLLQRLDKSKAVELQKQLDAPMS